MVDVIRTTVILLTTYYHVSSSSAATTSDAPNFVILVADDLGYGDVGIFGNTTLPTPNIDSLARKGVKLSHSLAAASLCTASRAALVTGRYPKRYGMASSGNKRVLMLIAQSGGLPSTETTFATLLSRHGYSTGLFGKWHLGHDGSWRGDGLHHPNQHGFHYFYGAPYTNLDTFNFKNVWTPGHRLVMKLFPQIRQVLSASGVIGISVLTLLFWRRRSILHFILILVFVTVSCVVLTYLLLTVFCTDEFRTLLHYTPIINSVLMRNQQVIEQPFYSFRSTSRFVKEAKTFMSEARQPFLVVVNFMQVHSYHMPDPRFKDLSNHGLYGDIVMELDSGVGEIMSHLKKLHIMNKTLVYFTSDNGGAFTQEMQDGQIAGGYNGPLQGTKGQGGREGAIRVPTIISWPSMFPKIGVDVSTPVSLMDLFPTLMEAAGITSYPGMKNNILDGKSLLPLIMSANVDHDHQHHQFIYHYCGSDIHSVTFTEDSNHIWKVYFYSPIEENCTGICLCRGDSYVTKHDPPQVFNLVTDLEEKLDLSHHEHHEHDKKYQQIVTRVKDAVSKHEESLVHDAKPAEDQFSFLNSIWRPDLQPCCSLTSFCLCKEEKELKT